MPRPEMSREERAADPHTLAVELRGVVAAMVRRFRRDRTMPAGQVSVLSALTRLGPLTTSELAAADRVRHQSMAATVAGLEEIGHVERRRDPQDGRKVQIVATKAGTAAIDAYRLAGESWLATAMEERLTPAERRQISKASELLARLVDEAGGRPARPVDET